jgi:hypothetical protein
MFESNEQLLAEAKRIMENQSPEFQQVLSYTIENTVDPNITELVNFISSEEVQFSTFSRA